MAYKAAGARAKLYTHCCLLCSSK